MPLGVHAALEPDALGKIAGVSGLPTPYRGSVVYGVVYSFGYLLTQGWDTRPGPRGSIRIYLKGVEDSDARKG
jgi:hypothetical protein